eukprot:Amastigsp_a2813_7.p3 type:complete len:236 gc:universal Amastigsp_a2813_7:464-1171(+)
MRRGSGWCRAVRLRLGLHRPSVRHPARALHCHASSHPAVSQRDRLLQRSLRRPKPSLQSFCRCRDSHHSLALGLRAPRGAVQCLRARRTGALSCPRQRLDCVDRAARVAAGLRALYQRRLVKNVQQEEFQSDHGRVRPRAARRRTQQILAKVGCSRPHDAPQCVRVRSQSRAGQRVPAHVVCAALDQRCLSWVLCRDGGGQLEAVSSVALPANCQGRVFARELGRGLCEQRHSTG